ncbi:MAG: phosphate signaling complex protein PhoU [Leptolyngbyaceae cyanobacterium SM1_1_3]|nr:phosphate signaling complex protein PhoU [Leptolyngbyaceae cyanobacterium SM1_1_3]NJM85134.1 phosphate signaling complex protein PhoU [Leptolyngbyaceae cyanobacterium RM2_2_21]NJO10510.1 phosphate signaling complex protein PhoU [Leptolyngbyaceae cyanobacterium SL_1_1]
MTNSRPTRTNFDRQVRRLQRDILRMGALVESSCLLAREALCDRNLDAAKKLEVQDRQIDQFYRQIELDCINLLTVQSPVTQDLRLLSAFMQLVRDLERIGDYSKDIGEVAIKLFPYPVDPCIEQVRTMLDRCRAMVALSLVALSNLDAETGNQIKDKDDAVDQDYEDLYILLAHQRNVEGIVEPIVLMVLVIRYLERIADHATNIGKRVAFIVTGQRT